MCAALSEKPSVLLITSTPRAHQGILTALQQQGFSVGVATDGESGYQKAQLILPRLILLDSSTPSIPALSLVRMLNGLSTTSSIPIIYLASVQSYKGGSGALQAGAIDYLSCPYQTEELLARIQIHIRLSEGASSEIRHAHSQLSHSLPQESGQHMEDQMLVHATDGVIRENLSSPLTQKALAHQLQVSERRLVSAFKRCLDIRPSEYISQQRLKRAERLISTTTLSFSVIADELGYSSAANFSTAFKKYKGVSPRQFRKQPEIKMD